MNKKIIAFALSSIILVGCAGRAARPVAADQVGDGQRSCAAIELEMGQIQTEIQKLTPESDKTGKNVGLGIAGAFLLIPWFFMDLSDAEKAEIAAYQQRYNKLQVLATQKKCSFLQVTPDMNDPGSASSAKSGKKAN